MSAVVNENTIVFSNESKEPIILLAANGDIFVKGRLAENDKEVVDAMREFLANQNDLKFQVKEFREALEHLINNAGLMKYVASIPGSLLADSYNNAHKLLNRPDTSNNGYNSH